MHPMNRTPPPLPAALADPRPALVVGILAWLVAFLAVLVTGGSGTVLWTGLAGTVLGVLGLGIVYWQRAAARRGARSAQRGLI